MITDLKNSGYRQKALVGQSDDNIRTLRGEHRILKAHLGESVLFSNTVDESSEHEHRSA